MLEARASGSFFQPPRADRGKAPLPRIPRCIRSLQAVRELGLDEDVPNSPRTTRSTALGEELKLNLFMAFVGAWDMMLQLMNNPPAGPSELRKPIS